MIHICTVMVARANKKVIKLCFVVARVQGRYRNRKLRISKGLLKARNRVPAYFKSRASVCDGIYDVIGPIGSDAYRILTTSHY